MAQDFHSQFAGMKAKTLQPEPPPAMPPDATTGQFPDIPPGPEAAGLAPDEIAQMQGAMDKANTLMGESPEGAAEGGDGMTKLAEALGVEPDRAQQLYDAAQTLPKFAGKSPEELADLVAQDFYARAQLLEAAGGMDAPAEPTGEAPPMEL